MDEMMDKMVIMSVHRLMKEKRQTMLTHLYIIDDMMDEIMMLDNPEAMREIALFVKDTLSQMEKQV